VHSGAVVWAVRKTNQQLTERRAATQGRRLTLFVFASLRRDCMGSVQRSMQHGMHGAASKWQECAAATMHINTQQRRCKQE